MRGGALDVAAGATVTAAKGTIRVLGDANLGMHSGGLAHEGWARLPEGPLARDGGADSADMMLFRPRDQNTLITARQDANIGRRPAVPER